MRGACAESGVACRMRAFAVHRNKEHEWGLEAAKKASQKESMRRRESEPDRAQEDKGGGQTGTDQTRRRRITDKIQTKKQGRGMESEHVQRGVGRGRA